MPILVKIDQAPHGEEWYDNSKGWFPVEGFHASPTPKGTHDIDLVMTTTNPLITVLRGLLQRQSKFDMTIVFLNSTRQDGVQLRAATRQASLGFLPIIGSPMDEYLRVRVTGTYIARDYPSGRTGSDLLIGVAFTADRVTPSPGAHVGPEQWGSIRARALFRRGSLA